MTYTEKYPHSWQAVLQSEAQKIVTQIHNEFHCCGPCNYVFKADISHILGCNVPDNQKQYFLSLFGGRFHIARSAISGNEVLCVLTQDMLTFHYHAPLRVHPVRVYK